VSWRALLGRVPYLDLYLYGVVFALGFWVAWALYHPRPAPPLRQQQEVRQPDHSLVLRTQPATAREVHKAIPALPQVPQGATLLAGAEAVLAPHQDASQPGAMPKPKIRVDMALLRMQDGSERIALSSPDADVVGGVDMPVVPPRGLAQERGWGVGGFWNPVSRAWGPIVTKDWGPLRLGATGRIERVQVPGVGVIQNNGVDLSVVVHF